MNNNYETATLAGGCFWCLEAVYDDLKGVISVESGYSNGHVPNPTYRAVCNGDTGYAEVIRVTFDPSIIAFKDLLNVFFAIHDPTTLTVRVTMWEQYRSAIFYHSPEQKETAESLVKELDAQKIWNSSIVTKVEAVKDYYVAEDYHQEYFANNPNQPYCQAVVAPKVMKFRKKYLDLLKK